MKGIARSLRARVRSFGLLVVLSGMVLGCFNSDQPTPIGDQGETIHLLGVVGAHEAIVGALERKLAASHIRLEKNFYYWDTYLAKARMAIMNDTREYDVILGPCSQLIHFANNNKAVALEDVAERVGFEVKDLYPPIRGNVFARDHLFCLPYLADSLIYIYRADLFHKMGQKPPRTINEMYGIGRRLTFGNGDYGLAFPAGPGEGVTSVWSYFLWSYGGDYFDAGWHPTLNSRRAADATFIYNKILQDCAPPAVATWQTEEAVNFFAAGHLAAMILWSSAANSLEDKTLSKVAGKIGYAPLPVGGGGKAFAQMEAWGVIVPRASQHIIAAKKFCELLVSRESLATAAQSGIAPTPLPEINRRYAAAAVHPAFVVAAQSLAVSRERPNIPEATQFIPVIGSALNDILMGAELQAALDGANRQIEGIMELNGRYKKR